VRWSGRYDQTVAFYRDIIGLPVLETFHDSYGLDGTIDVTAPPPRGFAGPGFATYRDGNGGVTQLDAEGPE